MACIPPNPRRVGYIVPIYGPLDGPLYMGSIRYHKHEARYAWVYAILEGLCNSCIQTAGRHKIMMPEQAYPLCNF